MQTWALKKQRNIEKLQQEVKRSNLKLRVLTRLVAANEMMMGQAATSEDADRLNKEVEGLQRALLEVKGWSTNRQ